MGVNSLVTVGENIHWSAKLVSHEMGHNLGLHHDNQIGCKSCRHPQGDCVMRSYMGPASAQWSGCSEDTLDRYSKQGHYYCMD